MIVLSALTGCLFANALLLLIWFFFVNQDVSVCVCVKSTWTVVLERLCMPAQQIQQKSSNKTQDKGYWMWCKAQHQGYFIYMFIIKLHLHILVYAVTHDFSTLSKCMSELWSKTGGCRFFCRNIFCRSLVLTQLSSDVGNGLVAHTAEATLAIALINKHQTLVIFLSDCNVIVSDVLFLSCCKLAVLAVVATSSNNENY